MSRRLPQRAIGMDILGPGRESNCGAIPMNVHSLGADFIVCAGYKYLLSPGNRLPMARPESSDSLRPGTLQLGVQEWRASRAQLCGS